MQIAVALFQQVVVMFALMTIGYLLRRGGILGAESSGDLGKLLVNAVLPAVVVRSFWTAAGDGRGGELVQSFAISVVLLALAMAVGRALQARHPVGDFSVAFSNAGFIGIPLARAVLGDGSVFFIAPFIALLNVLQWTYGQRLLSGARNRPDIRSILLSPMLIAMVAGLALYGMAMPLPALVGTVLDDVAALNSPLAMIVLGCYLAESDLRMLLSTGNLYSVAMERLLVFPLLSVALLAFAPGGTDLKLSLLLAAAAPVGTNVAIFARQNDSDYTYASGCVCLSTLASLVTMPVVMAVATVFLG